MRERGGEAGCFTAGDVQTGCVEESGGGAGECEGVEHPAADGEGGEDFCMGFGAAGAVRRRFCRTGSEDEAGRVEKALRGDGVAGQEAQAEGGIGIRRPNDAAARGAVREQGIQQPPAVQKAQIGVEVGNRDLGGGRATWRRSTWRLGEQGTGGRQELGIGGA